MRLEEKQRIEIDFWKTAPTENPEANSVHNMVNKMTDAPILLDCLENFKDIFVSAQTILELGAGQGWASCIVKRLYPNAKVIVTDISEWATASVHKWQHVFQVQIDQEASCKSYEIPADDSSIACIFCFASAHHFIAHRRTLKEIHRVLEPGGHCFYFYEPSCPLYLYKLAYWRVNRKRPEVPEDVLIYKKIQALAYPIGLNCSLHFYPSLLKRGPIETIYYMILRKISILQQLLPCTINYHFKKPET